MFRILFVVAIIVLDQAAKYLSKIYLMPMESRTIPIIDGVFHLTYTENRGAAFSILQNQRWLFIGLTVIFIVYAVYYLIKNPNDKPAVRLGLSMVLAGAAGNLIDRIWLGYVVDFFDFRLINFPVFNIADCAVVLGCMLLVYSLLFTGARKKSE